MAASALERVGWLVVGAALAAAAAALWLGSDGPTSTPAPAMKNEKLAAAGRRGIAAAGLNTKRYRCAECDHETTAGPMGMAPQGHRT